MQLSIQDCLGHMEAVVSAKIFNEQPKKALIKLVKLFYTDNEKFKSNN